MSARIIYLSLLENQSILRPNGNLRSHQVPIRQRTGQPLGRRRHDGRLPDHRAAHLLSAGESSGALSFFGREGTAAQRIPADLHRARRRAVRLRFAQGDCICGGGSKFILLFPGEWHSYRPSPKTGWHEYWIGFTGPDIDRKLDAKFLDPHRPLFNVGYHEEIIDLYKLAQRTAQEQSSGFQQVLAGIVHLLLGFAYAEHKQTALEDMQVASQLNEAKIIMQDNFNRDISCQEVAARICMSYSRFRRLFRQYVGFAPAQYLLELKINKSKELLTNTALTCQEIAFESGFEYASHFNIAFKKKTGITPNQYRDLTQGRLREIPDSIRL